MKLFTATALAALAFPAAALGEDATIVSRDVPLRGGRALAASAPRRFDLVGLHWRGSGGVRFRTHRVGGGWSAWHTAAPEAEDLPETLGPESARRRGWRLGNPWWTGLSDRIEYRTSGRVRRLRAWFVTSPVERLPMRTMSVADSPAIVPRVAWNANERIRRASPVYADRLAFALVHHTAGSNTYTRAQSAAIVRAIELYHVLGNGWNDIGYNFLVDKYGQVFEGRYGGVDRNVVGAHAQGFNTGSVGVALLGNYERARPTAAAQKAIAQLLAWRLDIAHVDPISTLTWASGGNPRFPPGAPVFLRVISGHRDTGFTSCPGRYVYARIGAIAQQVARLGLPKLYDPRVRGVVPGPVRFTARLSEPLAWNVVVNDPEGQPLAVGSGTGTAVDWTWDGSSAPPGTYYYWMSAGPTVRPVLGTFGAKAKAVRVTGVTATPPTISPNGDGRDDETVIAFTLNVPATVTATLVDPFGATISRLFSDLKPAGRNSFVFRADGIADGVYKVALAAVGPDGKRATGSVLLTVDRTK